MTTARRRLRAVKTTTGDAGFTLVEALVAVAIFVTTMSVMTSVVAAMVNNVRQAQGVSIATDQVRLGFHRLDKQVRYANAISPPGPAGDGWYVELSMDDAKRDDRTDAADKDEKCRQWRVRQGRLETRSWLVNNAGEPHQATAWMTIATGLINDFATEPPFAPPSPGGRVLPLLSPLVQRVHQGLTVDLHAKRSHRPVGRAHLKATFFARNTTPTTPSVGVCDQLPRS